MFILHLSKGINSITSNNNDHQNEENLKRMLANKSKTSKLKQPRPLQVAQHNLMKYNQKLEYESAMFSNGLNKVPETKPLNNTNFINNTSNDNWSFSSSLSHSIPSFGYNNAAASIQPDQKKSSSQSSQSSYSSSHDLTQSLPHSNKSFSNRLQSQNSMPNYHNSNTEKHILEASSNSISQHRSLSPKHSSHDPYISAQSTSTFLNNMFQQKTSNDFTGLLQANTTSWLVKSYLAKSGEQSQVNAADLKTNLVANLQPGGFSGQDSLNQKGKLNGNALLWVHLIIAGETSSWSKQIKCSLTVKITNKTKRTKMILYFT